MQHPVCKDPTRKRESAANIVRECDGNCDTLNPSMLTQALKIAWMPVLLTVATVVAAPPRVTSDRYTLELIAKEPQIVTPVGLAFDREGRLLVVESHTHDRAKNYSGRADDRILMVADSNGDGRLDHWSTFADGLRFTMNLLVRPDGGVYVVSKGDVTLLRDTNGDGTADTRDVLLRLETEAPNPHNSLNGIARDPKGGGVYVGMGQTRTFPYRVTDAKGRELRGTDGAGNIFHITESGSDLRRVATGFWNPFSLCALPDGRIFGVDNDPDSSPPCRLLDIAWSGDYGYRYQYTRGGTHPLQSWNGELPGTLPMICGTGEAPTAIVAHRGSLWVTSWGDHRVDRYRLVTRGGSYGAERETIVQGDADFRPAGMAVAPDGSLYVGDWVLRDYPVHGKGRIWRITLPAETDADADAFPPFPAFERRDDSSVEIALRSADPFEQLSGIRALSQLDNLKDHPAARSPEARLRLGWLEAMRRKASAPPLAVLRSALADESADVRLFAVRWIADVRVTVLRNDVAKLLSGPQPTTRYYLAVLAAIDWLDHEPALRGDGFSDELLIRELENTARSPESHAMALSLLSPDHKFLTLDRLQKYLQSDDPRMRLEAARILAQQTNGERFGALAALAADSKQSKEVRAEGIMGLAAEPQQHQSFLNKLAQNDVPVLANEAQRALRLSGVVPAPAEDKPSADDLVAWQSLLNQPGDAAVGRRLFFSSVGPRCSVCHQHSGRGGRVGPELTQIGRGMTRERIVASILQPSLEIGPDFQPWSLVTKDGETHTGLKSIKPEGVGVEHYVDSAGKPFELQTTEIESREVSPVSIMPAGLEKTLSVQDLRDLLAFLTAQ